MAEPIKTAILGIGRWGKNVARELAKQSELVAFVSHGSPENEQWASEHIVNVQKMTLEAVCAKKDIRAVAVATPIATHTDIVRKLLESGKSVLCEKPLAERSKEAFELAELAKKHNVTLMTGYVYLFNAAYQELKKKLKGFNIERVEFEWKKYGTFGETLELNLLTHHFALALDLLGKPSSATILKSEAGETDCDILEVQLFYPSCEVISRIDRISKEKVHRMTVEAGGETFTWDAAQSARNSAGTFLEQDTSLSLEVAAFLRTVSGTSSSQTAGDFGARVLEIHEMLR